MAEQIYARHRSPRPSHVSTGKSHVSRGKSPKRNPLKILNVHELRGLRRTIGPPLIECMSEIIEKRPEDPIEFMAMWLYNYVDSQFYLMNKVDLSKQLMETEQEREDAIIFQRKQLQELKRRITNFKIKLAMYEESARIRKIQELEEKRLNERMLRLKEMMSVQTVVVQKKLPFRRKPRSTGGTSRSGKSSTITTETDDEASSESESEQEESEESGLTDKEKTSESSTAVSSPAGSGRSRASGSGQSQRRRKSHREQEEAGHIERRKKGRRLRTKKLRKADQDAHSSRVSSADAGSRGSSDIGMRKKERRLRKKKAKKAGVDKLYGEEGTADELDERKTAAQAKPIPGKSSRFQRAGSYAEPPGTDKISIDKGGKGKKSMDAKLLEKSKERDPTTESDDENDSHGDERKRGGTGPKGKRGGKRRGESSSASYGSSPRTPGSRTPGSKTPGSRTPAGLKTSHFHSAKISEATSPVQAEWALDKDNRLTCFHPELGILAAQKPHIDDSPDAWVALGYACETFYDHEIYTNCDVLTGIPIKIDNTKKKKKKRKQRIKIRASIRSSVSPKSEDSPTPEQEMEEQEIEEQESEDEET